MSSVPTIDASKGFVALPASIMDIEMSLGAFRVLVELCNLACIRGYCWPGQDQLAERSGRSKSSISAYVQELRSLGLIETFVQTRASGYNYRCKYLVTFWSEWVTVRKEKRNVQSALANDDQPTERSVQPAERPSTKKNKTYKTQTSEPAKRLATVVSEVDKAWKEIADHSGRFRHAPPEGLVPFTRKLLDENPLSDPLPRLQLESALEQIWADQNVCVSADTITDQANLPSVQQCSAEGILALKNTIESQWRSHWRRAPTKDQFVSFVIQAIPNLLIAKKLKEVRCALISWEMVEKRLPSAA